MYICICITIYLYPAVFVLPGAQLGSICARGTYPCWELGGHVRTRFICDIRNTLGTHQEHVRVSYVTPGARMLATTASMARMSML